jgi:hypothetical protein
MIIARQKRKENIAEYLLYMWQVEDLIRANKFDMDSINRTVIAHYDQPEEVKKEIAQWYEELSEMMRSEGVMEKGHIQLNKNVIITLTDLHLRLLKSPLGRKACFTPRCGFQHKLFRTASCIRESFENSARALDGQFE